MTPETAKAIVEEVHRRAHQQMPLEQLLVSPLGFGLTTASPLQRAICRIADGVPLGDLATHPHVLESVGDTTALPNVQPDELSLLAGTRTFKSMLAAAVAIRSTQVCNTSGLGKGEIPRYPIVSLRKDLADVIFGHVRGTVLGSPTLRTLLLEEPTADTVMLRHPSGRPVEIKVVAGAKAGATLVARWLVGITFDEFPRMVGSEDGVVNYPDMRKSILSRLLPGATVCNIGSPWAPFGPAYELATTLWRRPSKSHVVVWVRGADKLNPTWWTPERIEQIKAADPDSYRTDYLAEFLEPEELFFPASLVDAHTRKDKPILAPEPGYAYSAAMDPATRSNAWTLVVGTRRGAKRIVVRAEQWRPTFGALDPREVLKDIAQICKSYGITTVKTDQWAVDALRSIAAEFKLGLVQQDMRSADAYEKYKTAQTYLTLGYLEFAPVTALLDDLKRVRRRVTQSGLSIVLPQTADGRHCDFAPSFVRMLTSLFEDYAEPPPPNQQDLADWKMRQAEEEEAREFEEREESIQWWDRSVVHVRR